MSRVLTLLHRNQSVISTLNVSFLLGSESAVKLNRLPKTVQMLDVRPFFSTTICQRTGNESSSSGVAVKNVLTKTEVNNNNKTSAKSFLTEFSRIQGFNISLSYLKIKELDQPGMSVWHFKTIFALLDQHHKKSFVSKEPLRSPSMDFDVVPGNATTEWKCKVIIFYPLTTQFEAIEQTKKKAEEVACKRAVIFLRAKNVIDANLKPVFHSDEERKKFERNFNAPVAIHEIPAEIREKMEGFLQKYHDKGVKDFLVRLQKQNFDSDDNKETNGFCQTNGALVGSEDVLEFEDTRAPSPSITFDAVTGMMYENPDEHEDEIRSLKLLEFIQKTRPRMESFDASFADYRRKMSQLPVFRHRDRIIETIEGNQVTVISGQTGSGKTTQIPLMIFEEMIRNRRGAAASMVVTQPRRLPAIAIADNVAYQFGEKQSGQSIGYHVRFEKNCPVHSRGGILFCTTGILTRKLASNPDLKGVSHVFVDEVHERDVICDFTLMLLKRLLQRNKELKVILMSASINAKIFSTYFNSAPVLDLEGRLFSVQCHHLPQVHDLLKQANNNNSSLKTLMPVNPQNPRVNRDQIVDLVLAIHKMKPDGAILCFLPGWEDIRTIADMLRNNSSCNNLLVVPVHSMLPHSDQKLIFSQPPSGVRKVVLATNIAETSLTVPDVVYVIDPGLCKEMRYDQRHHVTSFGLHWISRANTIQRQGRAGRSQPGQCFKLFDQSTESSVMQAFPTAEMLRIPLETVVIQAKLYCPQEKAEDFLSTALEAPSREALTAALRALETYGILDNEENLTLLGKKVVHFTLHPSLSVALISAAFIGVLDPALNVAATLSAPKEPFVISVGEKRSEARFAKNNFADRQKSDHVAFANLVKRYEEQEKNFGGYNGLKTFETVNRLSHMTMKSIKELKNICVNHLLDCKLIKDSRITEENRKSNSHLLLQAALLTGFYPNTVVVREGKLVNSKIKRGYTSTDVSTGREIRLVSESLLKDMSGALLSKGFITYFASFYSEEARQLTLRDGSLISPLTFFLFVGRKLDEVKDERTKEEVVYRMDHRTLLKFSLKAQDAALLLQWKDVMIDLSFWWLRKDLPVTKSMIDADLFENLMKCHRMFFSLTHQLLEAEHQKGF